MKIRSMYLGWDWDSVRRRVAFHSSIHNSGRDLRAWEVWEQHKLSTIRRYRLDLSLLQMEFRLDLRLMGVLVPLAANMVMAGVVVAVAGMAVIVVAAVEDISSNNPRSLQVTTRVASNLGVQASMTWMKMVFLDSEVAVVAISDTKTPTWEAAVDMTVVKEEDTALGGEKVDKGEGIRLSMISVKPGYMCMYFVPKQRPNPTSTLTYYGKERVGLDSRKLKGEVGHHSHVGMWAQCSTSRQTRTVSMGYK
jgi:hypothetical protein